MGCRSGPHVEWHKCCPVRCWTCPDEIVVCFSAIVDKSLKVYNVLTLKAAPFRMPRGADLDPPPPRSPKVTGLLFQEMA